MILVNDLIKWAKENTIGRSSTYWHGFISADLLEDLAKKIREKEPFHYDPRGYNDEIS